MKLVEAERYGPLGPCLALLTKGRKVLVMAIRRPFVRSSVNTGGMFCLSPLKLPVKYSADN